MNLTSPDHLAFLLSIDNATIKEISNINIITYTDIDGVEYNTEGEIDPSAQKFEKSYVIPANNINEYGLLGKKLGEGAFGNVYQRGIYADKIVKFGYTDTDVIQEISIILRLNHPNIINIIDIGIIDNEIHIIMPIALKSLQEFSPATEFHLQYASYQMIRSVAYCHSKDIIHGDIKLTNFLTFHNGLIKLSDFGLSHGLKCNLNVLKLGQTLLYSAPELLLDDVNSIFTDIWALGVSLYEFYTQDKLFCGETEFDILADILGVFGPITELTNYPKWEQFLNNKFPLHKDDLTSITFHKRQLYITTPFSSKGIISLLDKIFQLNPNKRPDALTILNDKYFDTVRARVETVFPAHKIEITSCEDNFIVRSRIPKLYDYVKFFPDFYWMFDIFKRTNFNFKVFFSCIDLFDSQIKYSQKDKSRLYNSVCLYLAIALNERTNIELEDFREFSEFIFTEKEFKDMTKRFLIKSKFDLLWSNSYDYLNINKPFYDDKINKLSETLLLSSIFTNLRFSYSGENLVLLCIFMSCRYYDDKKFQHKKLNTFANNAYIIILENLKNNRYMKKVFEITIHIKPKEFVDKLVQIHE